MKNLNDIGFVSQNVACGMCIAVSEAAFRALTALRFI